MSFTHLSDVSEVETVPGFHGRFVHSDNLTVAHWRIVAGAKLPEHSHPHEQIADIIEGEMEFVIDGVTQTATAGTIVIIPSNVKHSGRAVTNCKIIDVFYPVREDYRKK